MTTRFTTGLRTSSTPEWATPLDLFTEIQQEFGPFTLDPCATPQNAKAPLYYTKRDDGLTYPWAPHKVWMNPPYGTVIGRWVQKAYDEAQLGALVVCLLPSRTDTRWWHEYVMKGEVRFLKGRVAFNGRGRAPFPSALVIFHPKAVRR